jgi:OmpA-OmpF porin, OOP family
MRCNWWRWLWGIVPLLVLSWVAIQAEQGRIETDLRARASAALAQGGMGWTAVELTGRDAVLLGLSGDEAEPQKAASLLSHVWGLRVVENKIDLAPKAEKYTWTAGRRGNRIRITGHVPNRATRKIILGVARANFPSFEVLDRMETTRGVPSPDMWLGGVSFALKQLASLKRGDVRLEGLGFWISGEAEDIAAYRAIKSALGNNLPKGIKLTDDLVTPPVVNPFTWSAQLEQGRLVLSGYVPSEAARAELLAVARAGTTDVAVLDKMQPGEGAPQGWNVAAAASVRELARLLAGNVDLKDGGLVVSGLAGDGATAEAVRGALRAAMPASIKLTEHIKTKELPPPQPPPLPAPVAAPPTPPPTPTDASKETQGARATAALPSASPQLPPSESKPVPAPSTPPPGPVPSGNAGRSTSAPAEWAPKPGPPETRAKACQDRLQELAKEGGITFALGSAELAPTASPTLDKLAAAAKSCPGMVVEVGGHTSSEGSFVINQQLSIRRAQSVVTYLAKAGVDASQLQPVGYGASRPVAPNDTEDDMAKNRRIEFAVRPKLGAAN